MIRILISSIFVWIALFNAASAFTSSKGNHVRTLRMSSNEAIVTIGTRGSPLALAQAYETKRLLGLHFPELAVEGAVEIRKIMTKGDSILNQALSEIGGKGLFTKELDVALMQNEVDICVHSMKDVPTWLIDGTVLPCNLQREETNDVFISKKYKTLKDLPDGAIIGSASLRRQAQLLAMNPTFQVVNFRGNVQTRLKKIENGVVDATLLALAGLKRLNMGDVIADSQVVDWVEMLPAVAQGAIGIQCRADDSKALKYLSALNHAATKAAVDCERAFLRGLDGNCRTPIAGQAEVRADQVHFQGFISMPDGTQLLRTQRCGSVADAERIGAEAAQEIRAMAGDKFASYQTAVLLAQDAKGWANLAK